MSYHDIFTLIIYIIIILFAAAEGAFLNLCIERLPKEQPLFLQKSKRQPQREFFNTTYCGYNSKRPVPYFCGLAGERHDQPRQVYIYRFAVFRSDNSVFHRPEVPAYFKLCSDFYSFAFNTQLHILPRCYGHNA